MKERKPKVLRKVHIEDIASSLGESVFSVPVRSGKDNGGILGENRLGLPRMRGTPFPSLPSFKET